MLSLLLACAHPIPPEAPVAAQSIEPVETLELDGVPEIPADLTAALRPYLSTRSARLQAISDDGEQVIITTRFGESSQIHRLTTPMGARHQLTFRDEPIRGVGLVPGDSDTIVFSSDEGGDETWQIFQLTDGQTTRLSDGESRHGGWAFTDDGTRFAYTNNARNGRDSDLYLSEGRTINPDAEPTLEVDGLWFPVDWSADGETLLLGEYISITDSRLYTFDVASKTLTRLTPEDPPASYRSAVLSADGQTAFIATDREGEFVELYAVADGVWTPLTREIPWNVESVQLSPDGETLVFTVNEGGISSLRILDVATGSHRATDMVPPGRISGLQFAGDAPILGFTLETATSVGDVWTLDLTDETVTRWTESEVGGLDTSRFIEPELIAFTSFDGLTVPAFYYRPEGDGPFPVVVKIHGGPEAQSRIGFSPTTQYLATEQDIAVIIPNVRGSNGYGKSWLKMDNAEKREDSVRDIGALLDWIDAQPELDGERVAVSGGSYGGYMVLASLVHYGDRIRAGVDVVGISSFVTFLESTSAYRQDLRRVEYGDERDPEMRAHLEAISPVNRAEEITSALFVAHGANDPRVPLGEARQIVEAVRGGGGEVWVMVAHDEGHGFRKQVNRDMFAMLQVMFFLEQLSEG
ncbi:MAG: dipeptidyl aminopeptidase/acylaminoacyl peptidase [Myxococcota bacterium]